MTAMSKASTAARRDRRTAFLRGVIPKSSRRPGVPAGWRRFGTHARARDADGAREGAAGHAWARCGMRRTNAAHGPAGAVVLFAHFSPCTAGGAPPALPHWRSGLSGMRDDTRIKT